MRKARNGKSQPKVQLMPEELEGQFDECSFVIEALFEHTDSRMCRDWMLVVTGLSRAEGTRVGQC